MSSILSLSHYTTKYNLCQLLSTGHPLNISLFFNKDWTSFCFVTVTSCDGDADQHIIGGIRRCNISLCDCVGRESHVACCACVWVCLCAVTVKSIPGEKQMKKTRASLWSSASNVYWNAANFESISWTAGVAPWIHLRLKGKHKINRKLPQHTHTYAQTHTICMKHIIQWKSNHYFTGWAISFVIYRSSVLRTCLASLFWLKREDDH